MARRLLAPGCMVAVNPPSLRRTEWDIYKSSAELSQRTSSIQVCVETAVNDCIVRRVTAPTREEDAQKDHMDAQSLRTRCSRSWIQNVTLSVNPFGWAVRPNRPLSMRGAGVIRASR